MSICRCLLSTGLAGGLMALISACGPKAPEPVPAAVERDDQESAPKSAPKRKSLDQVMAELKNGKQDKRMEAVRHFAQLDPEEAFPALLNMAEDTTVLDPATLGEPNSLREAAVLIYQKLGPKGQTAVVEEALPILVAELKNADPDLRVHTLYAIALIGPKAKGKAGELLVYCEDPKSAVRRAAFETLSIIGGASAADYALLLNNEDPLVVYDAARALNAIRPLPKSIIPQLIVQLEKAPMEDDADEVAFARFELADALGSFGGDAEPAVPALIADLEKTTLLDYIQFYRTQSRRNTGRRRGETPTMAALRKIGKPAVPALIETLGKDKPFTQWLTARVIAGIGPDAAEANAALKKIFDGQIDRLKPDLTLISACGVAMVRSGSESKPIITKIADLLELATPDQRLDTAMVLAGFGRRGGPAVPAVIRLLDDEDEEIRAQAVETLRAFGPAAKDAVPALSKKLAAEEDFDARRNLVWVLKSLGAVAGEAGPELSRQLQAEDEAYRRDVIQAIAAIGPQANIDVAQLIKTLHATDERERMLTVEALGTLGPAAKGALGDLIVELKARKNSAESPPIMATLGKIGIASPEVIAVLTERLTNGLMVERKAAARALAELGPGAKPAVTPLQRFSSGSDPVARVWGAVALYRIGIDPKTHEQTIVAALKDRSPAGRQGRLAAMDVIELLGPNARQVVPELIDSLEDRSPVTPPYNLTPVGYRALQAIAKLGPAAKDAVKKLTTLLKEPDAEQKRLAIDALGAIGPDAEFAVARLREIVRTEPQFAEKAQAALEKIVPPQLD